MTLRQVERTSCDGWQSTRFGYLLHLCRPRPGSDVASVGAVSGTSMEGLSLSHLVTYLEPGLGLPDLTVFNSDVLAKKDAGVVLTGFFGQDWSMESGEFISGQGE